MTNLVVGGSLGDQLDALTAPANLCDRNGRVLGQFIPAPDITPQELAADGCPYSAEQLRDARRETGGRPLSEIWRDLGRS